jgi:glutathione S-transferase
MLKLYHHPFSAGSRFIRLMLAEHEAKVEMVQERDWERRPEFLALNPAGTVPVLVENDGPPIVGVGPIMEYVDETRGYSLGEHRLMPNHPEARAEMRRLIDWFSHKLHEEVTQYFAHEKILKLEMPASLGGGSPDNQVLRVARINIKHHLHYIGWLAGSRNWVSGERMSFADLAAAAELSVIDYLGEVPWDEDINAKHWYARVKSRPAFRQLLSDRVPGLPAAAIYANLDF